MLSMSHFSNTCCVLCILSRANECTTCQRVDHDIRCGYLKSKADLQNHELLRHLEKYDDTLTLSEGGHYMGKISNSSQQNLILKGLKHDFIKRYFKGQAQYW